MGNAKEFLDKHPRLIEIIPVIILIAIGCFVFFPMFLRSDLPLIDASAHYFKTWYLKKSIEEFKEFPNWCSYWYAGYPIFLFYSPGSYVLIYLFSKLTGLSLLKSFNTLFAISPIFEGVLLYTLMRVLDFSKIPALISGALLYANPLFIKDIGFNGAITYHIASIPAFLSIIFLIIAFKRESFFYSVLSGISFGFTILFHQTTVVCLFLPLFIVVSTVYLLGKNEKKKKLIFILIVAGIGLIISMYWWLPALIYHSYYSPYIWYKPVTKISISTLLDPDDLLYIGRINFLLGIFGFIYCISKIKEKNAIIPLSWSLLYLLILSYLIVFLGYEQYLHMFLYRTVYPLSFLGGISILFIPEIKKALSLKDKRYLNQDLGKIIITCLIFILLIGNLNMNHKRLNEWKEKYFSDPGSLKHFYDEFSKLPQGNTMVYGIPQIETSSAVPVMTGKPYILGWYNQGSPHYQKYENYLYTELNTKNSSKMYELYRLGGVRWLGIWIREIKYPKAYEVADMARENPELFKLIKRKIFKFKDRADVTLYIVEVKGSRQAYILRNGKFTDENVSFFMVNPHEIVLKTEAKKPFKIYVAQSYFPLWKCSSGEITKTKEGFMIVPGDNEVILKYEMPAFLYIPKFISLIGFFSSIFLLYFQKN
ncbi:MAG: hypothetical protein ACE5J3_05325 [Methanosarcinales archaeon]